MAKNEPFYPGLAEKVKQDIPSVFFQGKAVTINLPDKK